MFKGRVCIPSCDRSNEKIPTHASFSRSDFIRGVPETEHWNVITKEGEEGGRRGEEEKEQMKKMMKKELGMKEEREKKEKMRYFPSGPVAKTLCSQCRGPWFYPWSVK